MIGFRLHAFDTDTKGAELLAALGLDPETTFRYEVSMTGINRFPSSGIQPTTFYPVTSHGDEQHAFHRDARSRAVRYCYLAQG